MTSRPVTTLCLGSLLCLASLAAAELPTAERDALVALYDATGGPEWTEATGWPDGLDPCTWFGVTCSAGDSHVVALQLPGNHLQGTLPAELADLTLLGVLDLGDNLVEGPIPPGLGGLGGLEALDLGFNRLSGGVPPELGGLTALTTLDLRSNALAGELPGSLAGLTALADDGGLDLRYNGLFTRDVGLASFLDGKQEGGNWAGTQTVAPEVVQVTAKTSLSATLSWFAIDYSGDHGRYEVLGSQASGGPYTRVPSLSEAMEKDQGGTIVAPLPSGSTSFLTVRTVTFPHPENPKNVVISELSDEVPVTTYTSLPVYVDPGGDDAADCLTPDTACATVGEALGRLQGGSGPVRLAAGSYPESPILLDQVRLIGAGAERTEIVGSVTVGQWGSFVSHTGVLEGLTIRNPAGGGLWVNQGSLGFLTEVEVRDCTGTGVVADGARMVLDRVTIAGNGDGGLYQFAGWLAFSNCTVSDNYSVFGWDFGLSLSSSTLTNCTVTGHQGFGLEPDPGSTRVLNTLIAGNAGGSCQRILVSLGRNLTDDETCGLREPLGDLENVEPLLGPLADNGGPLRTHALGLGSPAIDAGEARDVPHEDARGLGRPQRAGHDIGAFEALPVWTFADVPPELWAARHVEAIALAGITAGCGFGDFCPGLPISRAEVAVQLVKAVHGPAFTPPEPVGLFTDVPIDHWAAPWIEQLAADSITAGCRPAEFCPADPVTRDQMAVLVLKSVHEPGWSPPPAVGEFDDVPVDHWAAAWIEQLAAAQITAGCSPTSFCPEVATSRAQMAVFVTRAFGLPF